MHRLKAGWFASFILMASACSTHLVVKPGQPASPPADTSPPPRSVAANLGIPPGHLPPPGLCRIWIPGRPPGHQSPPGSCEVLEGSVPPGGWLVYRPSQDKKRVRVSMYDASRPRLVIAVHYYDAATGKRL